MYRLLPSIIVRQIIDAIENDLKGISIVDSITKIVLFPLLQISNYIQYKYTCWINQKWNTIIIFFFCFFCLVNWRRSSRINHWKGQRRWLDFENFASFFIFNHAIYALSFLSSKLSSMRDMEYRIRKGTYRECHKYRWSKATAMLHSSYPIIHLGLVKMHISRNSRGKERRNK